MQKFLNILLFFFLLVSFSACSLQKEVDLDLPEFEAGVVVESYLEPGSPFFAILVESVSYLGSSEINFVKNADVFVRWGGNEVRLTPFVIPLDVNIQENDLIDIALLRSLRPIIGDSVYFYASLTDVPEEFDQVFQLEINTQDGQTLTADTRIPRPIPIDSMEYRFDVEDSLAFSLTKWQDPGDEVNFYRRILEKSYSEEVFDSLGNSLGPIVRNDEIQDFIIDDDIENGQLITIGSNFEFVRGDTTIAINYHITEAYYRFIETTDAAFIANLSPFGQPTLIESNVKGGTGIFTGFSRTSRSQVIGE